jgi:hypothetical protein
VLIEAGVKYILIGAGDTVHPPLRVENRAYAERVRVAQVSKRYTHGDDRFLLMWGILLFFVADFSL